MSADIVSTVMLALATRTQELAQIAVLRRSNQMQADMLQMIDDGTARAPAPAASSGHRVDKRA